jgi:hypothetical protein
MKHVSMLVLRGALVLLGLGVFAAMLWEPQFEGRNVNADFATIYFRDPFLAYAYLGSVPFFVGLYQAFRFLGYVGRDEAHSSGARKALRNIRYCALAVVGFVVGAEVWIMLTHGEDDAAGAFALGMGAILLGLLTVAAAAMLERALRGGRNLRSSQAGR